MHPVKLIKKTDNLHNWNKITILSKDICHTEATEGSERVVYFYEYMCACDGKLIHLQEKHLHKILEYYEVVP